MIIFLPVKPKYAQSILDGTKRYEFRRTRFSRQPTKAVLYSSSPVCRVVGYFTVTSLLKADPETLWEQCSRYAGIDRPEFDAYFKGKREAIALQVGKVMHFQRSLTPAEIAPGFSVPQSFRYIEQDLFEHILDTSAFPLTDAGAAD